MPGRASNFVRIQAVPESNCKCPETRYTLPVYLPMAWALVWELAHRRPTTYNNRQSSTHPPIFKLRPNVRAEYRLGRVGFLVYLFPWGSFTYEAVSGALICGPFKRSESPHTAENGVALF